MKAKTLIRKDTKEYVHMYSFGLYGLEPYTCELPQILSITADIETLKKINPDIDFSNYELIDIDIINSGEIGADIRNKLTPLKNLVTMLNKRENTTDTELYTELSRLIRKEINQCKISIDYLANLL